MFDYVVVDTPPQLNEHVLTALDASAHHVLVTNPDVPSLKNLRVVLDVLDMLSFPANIRSIVLNRAEPKLRLSDEDVERVIRTPITARIPADRAVAISVNKGTPITIAKPRHAVSKAITAFARQRLLPPPAPRRGRRQQKRGPS
jgi:pilus assembly protein CpaE